MFGGDPEVAGAALETEAAREPDPEESYTYSYCEEEDEIEEDKRELPELKRPRNHHHVSRHFLHLGGCLKPWFCYN